MKKLLVIDGNSLLFRAYYATAYGGGAIMSTKDGTPTNAIFAFANMLAKILSSFQGGESIFIGFDADGHTFRKEEFGAYKANRKPVPPDLVKQFPIVREFLNALGIYQFEEIGVKVSVTPKKTLRIANDKIALYDKFFEYMPRQVIIGSCLNLEQVIYEKKSEWGGCCVKLPDSCGGNGFFIIDDDKGND